MNESSLKIRTDFLKSLGIIEPCPCDFDFLAPIPDFQILKSLIKKTQDNNGEIGILAKRYNVKRYQINSVIRAIRSSK